MKIRIQTHNTTLPPGGSLHLQQRLTLALSAYQRDVAMVTVWLADLCGRSGQGLKRCLIEARLANGRFVIGEVADHDLGFGFERCIERIARKLELSLEREAFAPARSPDCLDHRQAQPCLSL